MTRRHRPQCRDERAPPAVARSSRSSSTRCSRASRASAGRRCSCRAPVRSCSGCSRTPSATPRSARSRASPPTASSGSWCRSRRSIIGDSVLGAEVRAGTFHFTWLSPTPTWQIVLGRWVGGSFVALVTIAPAAALAAVIAGTPESAARRRSSPPRSAARRTSRCSSRSRRSPAAPRCGHSRSCSSSSGCSARRSPASRSSRRRGSRGRSSSATSRDVPSDVVRTGIPQGGARDRPAGRS